MISQCLVTKLVHKIVYSLSPKQETEFLDADFTNEIEKIRPIQEKIARLSQVTVFLKIFLKC